MSFNLQDQTIEITCPNCNKKIKKKLAWFKGKRQCPHRCGLILDCDKLAGGITLLSILVSRFGSVFSIVNGSSSCHRVATGGTGMSLDI